MGNECTACNACQKNIEATEIKVDVIQKKMFKKIL